MHRAEYSNAACLQDGGDGGQQRQKARDTGYVAEWRSDIQGIFPWDGEDKDQQRSTAMRTNSPTPSISIVTNGSRVITPLLR